MHAFKGSIKFLIESLERFVLITLKKWASGTMNRTSCGSQYKMLNFQIAGDNFYRLTMTDWDWKLCISEPRFVVGSTKNSLKRRKKKIMKN